MYLNKDVGLCVPSVQKWSGFWDVRSLVSNPHSANSRQDISLLCLELLGLLNGDSKSSSLLGLWLNEVIHKVLGTGPGI